MISCILAFYLAVPLLPERGAVATRSTIGTEARLPTTGGTRPAGPARAKQPAGAEDPDALYTRREDLASARGAADIWKRRLATDVRDFEAAWKLARAHYWLGGHAPQSERKKFLEDGVAAGRTAAAIEPNRPEGHFWLAANMGALAESFGLRQGLKYRGEIRDALQIVLKIDPGFQQGSADRALGRWYYKVPGLFGGSKRKSEEHLRRSLTYNTNSIASRFFLAETLLDMDRRAEAVAELQRILELAPDPDWVPEDREFKEKAQRLLATLRQKRG